MLLSIIICNEIVAKMNYSSQSIIYYAWSLYGNDIELVTKVPWSIVLTCYVKIESLSPSCFPLESNVSFVAEWIGEWDHIPCVLLVANVSFIAERKGGKTMGKASGWRVSANGQPMVGNKFYGVQGGSSSPPIGVEGLEWGIELHAIHTRSGYGLYLSIITILLSTLTSFLIYYSLCAISYIIPLLYTISIKRQGSPVHSWRVGFLPMKRRFFYTDTGSKADGMVLFCRSTTTESFAK